jgi:hypothetical protein
MPPRPALKYTPEAIEQIKESVKQGLSREEIAKLLGVTVGSLQVTCSRLGISLRRPRIDAQSVLTTQPKTESPPPMVEMGSRLVAKLALTIRRKDVWWTLDAPLSQEAIQGLGIEAALRGVGLVELIAQVLCEAVKKDMVGTILDGEERPV